MSELRSAIEAHVSLTDTLQRAIRRQRSGDTRGARERYRRVLQASPRHYEALTLLGELERGAGNYQAAAAYFRAAIRIEPHRAEVFNALGQALTDGGESKAAMRAFWRAIEIDPEFAPTYVSMGRAFLRVRRSREAKRCFAEATRIDPALAEAHFCLADSMLEGGDAPSARREYLCGVELEPDAVEPRLRLASIFADEGRVHRAREQYEQSLRRAPENLAAHVGYASVLIEDQHLDEALDSCQKALQIDPRCAAAMVQLGRVHLRRSDVRGARQSFLNAQRLAPDLAAPQTGLAAVLELEGRIGEALAIMRRVIHSDDAGFEGHVLHARLLRKSGESGEALQRLRIRIASLPSSAARARRALELETARILEDDSRYDRALYHYATAAELSKRHFDVVKCRREVERVIAFFDSSAFARLSRAEPLAATPVIVVGMPSSGVRMLHRAVAAHSGVVPFVSAAPLARVAGELASYVASGRTYPDSSTDARSADLNRIVRSKWPQGTAAKRGECFFVDASWQCDLHLGLAELLFPNARVIHCVRDARDAALACYFRDYAGPECAFGANLPDIVTRLHLHDRLMRRWRRTGDLRILTVSRDALADEPLKELQRALAFVGLDFESACLAHAVPRNNGESPGFYTPTLDPSIGRHRNFENILGTRLDLALTAASNDDGDSVRGE